LALYYLRAIAELQGKALSSFHQDALRLLRVYPWPGNVRELIGEIEYAVSMADISMETLHASELSERIRANDPALPLEVGTLSQAVQRTEREQIVQALVRNRGHRGRAATDLQISRRTLYNKMTELGIKL
jgi:DNA-binding NtrC family response regulator